MRSELEGELVGALAAELFEEAGRVIREIAEQDAAAGAAYRSGPAPAKEDLEAALDALSAASNGDLVSAFYVLVDRRRGEVGPILSLCLDAVGSALRSRGELAYAAAAWSALPTGERDDYVDELLVELRIPRTTLDERVSQAGIDWWQRHLALHDDDAEGWACLAQHAQAGAEHELAERAAQRAIELDPSLPDPYLVLASLAEERGDDARARRILERASAHSNDPGIWLMLGEVLERSGELVDAEPAFSRSIDLDATLWGAQEGKRRVLEAQEEWQALADHLEQMTRRTTDLDQIDLLRRERHRICFEKLGQGDRVLEEQREHRKQRKQELREIDREIADGLANAPAESVPPARGSPLWVLGGVMLALAIVALVTALR